MDVTSRRCTMERHLNVKSKCWPAQKLAKAKIKVEEFLFPTKKATPPMQNSPNEFDFFFHANLVGSRKENFARSTLCPSGGSAVCLWCTEKSGSGSWLHCALIPDSDLDLHSFGCSRSYIQVCAPGNKIDIVPLHQVARVSLRPPQGG